MCSFHLFFIFIFCIDGPICIHAYTLNARVPRNTLITHIASFTQLHLMYMRFVKLDLANCIFMRLRPACIIPAWYSWHSKGFTMDSQLQPEWWGYGTPEAHHQAAPNAISVCWWQQLPQIPFADVATLRFPLHYITLHYIDVCPLSNQTWTRMAKSSWC